MCITKRKITEKILFPFCEQENEKWKDILLL